MKQAPRILVLTGAALLLAGAYLSFGRAAPQADPVAATQCRERMKDMGADMLVRCQDAAFATAMTATDANQAAAAISAVNNREVGGNALGMFLLGLGLVFAIAGVVGWRKQAGAANT